MCIAHVSATRHSVLCEHAIWVILQVRQTAVSYNGSTVLACCEDGTIWRWDAVNTLEGSQNLQEEHDDSDTSMQSDEH